MNIIGAEAAVWWISIADEIRPVRGGNPLALREAIQSVFSFSFAPAEIKINQGLEFQTGRLVTADGTIPVAKLVAFNDGLNLHIASTTADADKVLAAVLDTLVAAGMREPITPPHKSYISYIIADLDHSIDRFFPKELSQVISDALGQRGLHTQAIHFAADPELTTPKSGLSRVFRIERREGVHYSKNRYFSAADMTTEQHTAVIAALEQAAAKAPA